MIILELKLVGTARQFAALYEAIRTTQFMWSVKGVYERSAIRRNL